MNSSLANLVTSLGGLLVLGLFYVVVLGLPILIVVMAIRNHQSVLWQLGALGFCILFAIAPLILYQIGAYLAEQHGCSATGLEYQCPNDPELGSTITTLMFIGAWGPILTIPIGSFGFLGVVIAYLIKSFAK